jgi:hypothetical protein
MDEHAEARDRKREQAQREKTMRGNRSVFTITDAIAKRGRKARRTLAGEEGEPPAPS